MIIQSKRVFIAGQFIKAQIVIEEKRIKSILPYGKEKPDADYGEYMIVPGFIDVHTHGAYGYSSDQGDISGMDQWVSKLPEEGVTAFLPTTSPNPKEVILKALRSLREAKDKKMKGAEILGVHLEGPFFDEKFRGANTPDILMPPSVAVFKEFQEASGNAIRYMTIACEHDKDLELTKYAVANKVAVSLGHSGATYEEAVLAIGNGVTSFTHSFNAMLGLHHREPGVVGALMASNTFAEIIGDGHHVHPSVINILFKARKNNKMVLISDSLMAKGLGKGVYQHEGRKVEVDERGTARIFGTNTIAGGSLKINEGIRLLVREAMVSIEHALLAASLYPAQLIGADKKKGQILSGLDADMVILDDDYNVKQTYCLGEAMIK